MSQDFPRIVQEICPAERLTAKPPSLYVRHSGRLSESRGFHLAKFNREYNLHFVVEGSGVVAVDGVEWRMSAGDVFMFFPGRRTEHYDFPESRWRYYWIALRAPEGGQAELDAALAAAGIVPESPCSRLDPGSELWSFVPKLHRRLKEGSYGGLFPVAAAWRVLDALSEGKGPAEPSLAERLRNYVDSLEGSVSVKELALRFGVSRATLHRAFKGAFGESLKACLQARRFATARELLESGMDVRQAAQASGFGSAQHFCRAFKERFGETPGRWRGVRNG